MSIYDLFTLMYMVMLCCLLDIVAKMYEGRQRAVIYALLFIMLMVTVATIIQSTFEFLV